MDIQQPVDLILETLSEWIELFFATLPGLVVAVLVVLVTVFVARLVRDLVLRLMRRMSAYGHINRLLATTAYVAVFVVGVVIALGVLGLDKAVASLLAGAGIIGLALGFAFQDITANFISGVLLSVRRPFVEGDIIETNDYMGVVETLNIRATELRTFQGQLVVIPNKEVFQNPLVNYTRTRSRRVDLACGVAYGDDLEKARHVAVEAVTAAGVHDAGRPVDLFFEEFGDSSINFVLRFWIPFSSQTDYLAARSEAVIALKKAFDAEGITIPFPIRTLDFGVVGGEPLSDVLHAYRS